MAADHTAGNTLDRATHVPLIWGLYAREEPLCSAAVFFFFFF